YLTNMKGMFFPNYTDKQSGLNLLAPNNAYIKKVPKEKRVKWRDKERKAYREWYEKKYGKKTWTKFEIHHQLPREYGGGNQKSNLVPLDKSFHRSEVNPWWASYSK
ncbi:HNH endonuclease signature motif containing protein, partial [Bacillus velezensis]